MALSIARIGRSRSSTGASRGLTAAEQGTDTATLILDLRPHDTEIGEKDLPDFIRVSNRLSHEISSDPSQQDTFRRGRGFEALTNLLSLTTTYIRYEEDRVTPDSNVLKLVHSIIGLLFQALRDHYGSQKYFSAHLRGWLSVESCLSACQTSLLSQQSETATTELRELHHDLFVLACCDKSTKNLLKQIDQQTQELEEDAVPSLLVVQNAEAWSIAVGLAIQILSSLDPSSSNISCQNVGFSTICASTHLAQSSTRNKTALWRTGVLGTVLSFLLTTPNSSGAGHIRELCLVLADLGIENLDDVAALLKHARDNGAARSLLLDTLTKSKQPPFIQFDLSLCGYSSIEIASLPRAFPPSNGYTFTAWLRFDRFDTSCHTTIFGAFDQSQTCFILFYLEKDSQQLILQTSIRSARPSVRFKTFRFESGTWYHVALVHKRETSDPRNSPAALFVNGDFIEKVNCTYPETPAEDEGRGQSQQSRRLNPVQAFFATPHDLAMSLKRGVVHTKWSLGSAFLYQVPILDEYVAVLHKLGPRYQGNLQDCLGPLLTYRSSAELARYNELLHPDKGEKSDILTATEKRGSDVLSENRILISFSPAHVKGLDSSSVYDSIKRHELDRRSLQKYEQLRLKTRAVAVNGAIASINEAIARTYGVGILTGDPLVVIPKALDDSIWCLAGAVPALIRLVESANTKPAFLDAVKIFLQSCQDNWRISEAMERGHGFGMLALIIREKIGLETASSSSAVPRRATPMLNMEDRKQLPIELLHLVLQFVGYNKDEPEHSMIINPMAYRVLLLDFDTWRRCDDETQLLYYTQFVHFASHNVHSSFNHRRLNRMRVVRKLMDAFKMEDIVAESAPDLIRALKALLAHNQAWSSHCRDLAMFVVYGLQEQRAQTAKAVRSATSISNFRSRPVSIIRSARNSRPGTPGGQTPEQRPCIPRSELALRVLRLMTDLICDDKSIHYCKRFYDMKRGGIPNRWLLHLLAEADETVIILALRILAQSLLVLGPDFKTALVDKNGGFHILRNRMKGFWRSSHIWTACFAVLFGCEVPITRNDDHASLFAMVESFTRKDRGVAHPEVLSTIMGMLEAGLKSITQTDEPVDAEVKLLRTMIQFLNELFSRSVFFRDFAMNSRYVQDLLFVLYPVLVGCDRLSAKTELSADKDSLSFNGEEVKMRPHSSSVGERPSSVRSLKIEDVKRVPSPLSRNQVPRPRRLSSFVFVGSTEPVNPPAQFSTALAPKAAGPVKMNVGNSTVESLLEVITSLFITIICTKKDFQGTGLFLKVPPGFREHQAYFESYILVNTLTRLWNHLQMNQAAFIQTKVLTNLSKYSQHMAEALFEGWFIDGAQAVLDFTGKILEFLQQPSIATMNEVRLCSHQTTAIRVVFLRVTLWRLSELDETLDEKQAVTFLDQMNYWQTILFSSENQETLFIRLICYLLYMKITSEVKSVRLAAARLWRTILVQKPTESATLLTMTMGAEQRHLATGFMKLASMDEEDFIKWIDENRSDLDRVFIEALSKPWDEFVNDENRKNAETARGRLNKRREKLRQWQAEETSIDDVLHRYETSTQHWRSNVHAQERLKLQRTVQDQQETTSHLLSVFAAMEKAIHQPSGLEPVLDEMRWQLDETEAASRMRMRMVPDNTEHKAAYQPKRKVSERNARLSINTKMALTAGGNNILSANGSPLPESPVALDGSNDTKPANENREQPRDDSVSGSQLLEGGFEMVEDPNENDDGIIEDKNRKIMTRMKFGDECQQLYNISRVVGLEACEGLLIVGRTHLYMQDNYFQRSDGEIVSVSHAPEDERDPYVQLISGKDVGHKTPQHSIGDEETRHWTWLEVLSASKRRFLFRDVSLEVFFTDGRSYLLTCISSKVRDDLYSAIVSRAPHIYSASAIAAEDSWRLDTLRNPEEVSQSFGSKVANVFNQASAHAATKSWARGEMSNFQYLMLINTMAGRTFNDLTQYPVFPWVLADYSSEELDLEDPRTFRDLTKPMGCQTPLREAEYRERYQQFAEMGDENAPAFHYGTHYSSAMIVSSYLIRLQPFVQSYLLLQGGAFDHADRLFDSVERAWQSASKDTMSDVRELTPEFFYLPEFLQNTNKYDFGVKQGNEVVNHVKLPRWAKGDPQIFITKQREALESPYVSQRLHHWIDLIFGYKQRGEAAVEAANVFQHLSYQGAKNLDDITDPVERLASIGIIHSFGQTPHQVFAKAHAARDAVGPLLGRLDRAASFLIRLPDPVYQTEEKITSLAYSSTQSRLLCAGPGRLNLLPDSDRFVQWGFTDHSLRFYSANTKRMVGLYENIHKGPVSTATFPDSRTLVTGGEDCTIAVWAVAAARDAITLAVKTYLFGHRAPITMLTASRVCSTLVSASADGHVLIWGLNRLNCIRALRKPGSPTIQAAKVSNVSGHIALCEGPYLCLYTLNGHQLLKQKIGESDEDTILSCAFYEGAGNEWLEQELIFTGHSRGTANVWALTTLSDGAWYLQLVKCMNHADMTREDGANVSAGITAILPLPNSVFTGDEDGRVWEWDCVQRHTSYSSRFR